MRRARSGGWVVVGLWLVASAVAAQEASERTTDEAPAEAAIEPTADAASTADEDGDGAEEEPAAPPSDTPSPTSTTRRAHAASPTGSARIPPAYRVEEDPERPPVAGRGRERSHAEGDPDADAILELAITLNGILSFSTSTTPSVSTSVDAAIALGTRAWLGLGVSLAYSEQHTPAFPGSPEVRTVTTSFAAPLILQFYLDEPRVGAAVPTLRVQLAGLWSESPRSPGPSLQYGGASLSLLAGITWFGARWIALRVVGGVSSGVRAAYVGPQDITANVDVIALVSAVVRL